MSQRYYVVLAGGVGSRLWPVSRDKRPKQFHGFGLSDSLLGETFRRSPEGVIHAVVTNSAQKSLTQNATDFLQTSPLIWAEPAGRNTAPAIAFSLRQIHEAAGHANPVVAFLPADHWVAKPEVFRAQISAAYDRAEKFDEIVTLGVTPTYAATGYGYMECAGDKVPHKVLRFREKPNQSTAKTYVDAGNYFWNAGIFVARLSVFTDEFAKQLPPFAQYIRGEENIHFSDLQKISFDYGVMEGAKNVSCVPTSCGWTDLGDWKAVSDLLGNPPIQLEGENNTAVSQKPVVFVGLSHVVAVETQDAILVCAKDASQSVRQIRDELAANKLESLL